MYLLLCFWAASIMMNSIEKCCLFIRKLNVDQELSLSLYLSLLFFFLFNDGKGRRLNELYIDEGLSFWTRVCPP
jgi:hypothetical protein